MSQQHSGSDGSGSHASDLDPNFMANLPSIENTPQSPINKKQPKKRGRVKGKKYANKFEKLNAEAAILQTRKQVPSDEQAMAEVHAAQERENQKRDEKRRERQDKENDKINTELEELIGELNADKSYDVTRAREYMNKLEREETPAQRKYLIKKVDKYKKIIKKLIDEKQVDDETTTEQLSDRDDEDDEDDADDQNEYNWANVDDRSVNKDTVNRKKNRARDMIKRIEVIQSHKDYKGNQIIDDALRNLKENYRNYRAKIREEVEKVEKELKIRI